MPATRLPPAGSGSFISVRPPAGSTRDDERANRDERRLLNRLRADLIATFPAAMQIAGDDLGRPTFLRMLERWPTAQALRDVPREQNMALAKAGHHGWPDRFADQITDALKAKHSLPATIS
jgi:hypothetical protein